MEPKALKASRLVEFAEEDKEEEEDEGIEQEAIATCKQFAIILLG